MEPLEWAALIAIISSIGGGIYSGIKDENRYQNEMDFRDDITQKKYNDMLSLGASPAYALQSAGGMSNASTGTSYNAPFNMADALRNGAMSDLINANRTPFQNEKDAADAAKSQAEANDLPRWYDAQIAEMQEKANNLKKNNKYLDFMIESGRDQVAADVQLKTQQAITESAKVQEIMANVDVLVATEKDIQSQTQYREGIQTDIGKASLGNIEAQTNNYVKLLDKIQNEINVGESQIELNNTIATLNEAKEKQVSQETNNLIKDALLKDYQIYVKSLGFDKDYYISGGPNIGDLRSGYAPARDKSGIDLRRNMAEFQKFIEALEDYDKIANGTKGVVKSESGWPRHNKFIKK